MAEQGFDITRLLATAGVGPPNNLEDLLFRIWGQQFPTFTLSEPFLQRLTKYNRRQNHVHHMDQDHDRNQPAAMDRITFDRTTHIAWFAEEVNSGIPGLIRAARPLSLENVYFEIEILCAGQKGAIAIGLVPDDYEFGNQPGWRQGSIGYHADDGGIFIECGHTFKYKEKCHVGDRMGCGIELMEDGRRFVYFTRNGEIVAEQPFETGKELYPAVGMNSPGERVKLCDSHIWDLPPNDGQDQGGMLPWKDPEDLMEELDLTVIPQTGHIDFFWQKDGFRDVMLQATVPFSKDKAFFEFEIFAFGENEDISIGLVPKDFPLCRHPGWLLNSVGFHVAQGQFYTGQPQPRRGQVEKLSVGDRLGCGLEHNATGAQVIYFTKNGQTFLEEDVVLPDLVFPAVGMRSAGRTVSICVQDCDTWGYTARNLRPGASCASGSASGTAPSQDDLGVCIRQSAIEINAEACIAQLNGVEGQTTTATMMAVKPFSKDLSYFEIEILAGESVVVGAVPRNYDLSELPGCHAQSVAYHSDDGGVYVESGRTRVFVGESSHGDVISCGISDQSDELRRIFYFAVNRQTLFEIPFGDSSQLLYPAIGMKSEVGPARVLIPDLSIWKAPAPSSSSSASASGSSYSTSSGAASSGSAVVPADPAKRDSAAVQNRIEMIQKELECAICWNILVQPKLFPCQKHSFCLACLRNHAEGILPQGKISCPVCRKETLLPWGGVDEFQDNVSIVGFIDIFKKL